MPDIVWLPTLYPALISFASVLLLTPVVRSVAQRTGMVAKPRADRWHSKPTALLGGIAIFLGFAITIGISGLYEDHLRGILIGSSLIFVLGLVDDLVSLPPLYKLIGVFIAGGFVISSGLALPWFPGAPVLDFAVTMLWLVGITNAMNLLDNMDGLSPGVACIASIFLALAFAVDDHRQMLMLALMLAGALAAFLIYNFHPASIFMGDSGSMFLGFFLASLTLMNEYGRSRNLMSVLAGPVLPFLIPIFDTTFVTVSRLLTGRKISEGGRDHTSHRLARVAGSERNAVLILYAVSIISGLLALVLRLEYFALSFALIPLVLLALLFFGLYLGQVQVAIPSGVRDVSFLRRLRPIVFQSGLYQIGIDTALIVMAYYMALLLRFEGHIPRPDLDLFYTIIPILVLIKLSVLIVMGAYRHLWRHFGIATVLVYAKSIAVSSAIGVMVATFVFRFSGFSRAVFILDAILLMALIVGTRISLRLFHATFQPPSPDIAGRQRALIYGVGELGALVAREFAEKSSYGYFPIGFIDDDPAMHSRSINGLPIFCGIDQLASVVREQSIQAVLAMEGEDACNRLDEVGQVCENLGVSLKRIGLRVE